MYIVLFQPGVSGCQGRLPDDVDVVAVGEGFLPAAGWGDVGDGLLGGFGCTPGVGDVGIDGGVGFEDGVDDAPGFFDVVLAGEESSVAGHGVGEDALVGFHLLGAWVAAGFELDEFAGAVFVGWSDGDGEGDGHLGADAHADVILGSGLDEVGCRRAAQAGDELCAGGGEVFARADVEGDTIPAPGFDIEAEGGEGFDGGVGGDTFFVVVADELAADQVAGFDRWDGFEDFYFFVADGFAVVAGGALHGDVCT